MSIIRVVKDSRLRYLLTDAEPHLRTDLSWEARGLHAYLMLKPDNWEVRVEQLMKAGPAGRVKLRRMLKELQEAGYLNRKKIHDPKTGEFSTIATVYERVDLNPTFDPEDTPIYGGTVFHQGTKPTVDQGRFTSDGKHAPITNTDLSIKRGNFRHLEIDVDPVEDAERQAVHDMSVALGTVCQGFVNLLVPDNCKFNAAAWTLLAAGITEEQVYAFREWWKENSDYQGQPSLTSLMNKIENMIGGVNPGQRQEKSKDLIQARKDLDSWIARRIGVLDFKSPHTLRAIQSVGEATIRGINNNNKRTIYNQFETEYTRAKRDAQTTTAR